MSYSEWLICSQIHFPTPLPLYFFGLSWKCFLARFGQWKILVGDQETRCLSLAWIRKSYLTVAVSHHGPPSLFSWHFSSCLTVWLLRLVPSSPPLLVNLDLLKILLLITRLLQAPTFGYSALSNTFQIFLLNYLTWTLMFTVGYSGTLAIWIVKQRPLSVYLCVADT